MRQDGSLTPLGAARRAAGPRDAARAACPPSSLFTPATPAPHPPRAPGLVKCHTSARDDFCAADAWRHRFPDASLVPVAAAMFPQLSAWAGEEGPRWQITIGPGIARVGTKDRAKEARTHDRVSGYAEQRRRKLAEQAVLFEVTDDRAFPGRAHKHADMAATLHDHPRPDPPVRYAARDSALAAARSFPDAAVSRTGSARAGRAGILTRWRPSRFRRRR